VITDVATRVVDRLRSVLPVISSSGMHALHEPEFTGNERDYVVDCIDTGWVSSVGGYVDRIERDLEAITGAARAVAVSSGTGALQIGLSIAGVETGDEVLLPTLTFVGTANAICHAGAIPHFVDSDPQRLAVDPKKLHQYLKRIAERQNGKTINRQTGRPISALIVVHIFGHPADIVALQLVADEFGITIVEDAAESLGSTIGERHTGTFGQVSALSFNGNKVVTTGGGGAILSMDTDIGDRAKHLTTTARVSAGWEFDHDEIGWNFRMPNLNAALGCAQLEHLQDALARKRRLAARYANAFADVPNVSIISEPTGCRSNFWLNAIMVDNRETRNAVLEASNAAGFMARPCWRLMHTLPMFTSCPRDDLSMSEHLVNCLVNLPSSPQLIGAGETIDL
jgi:perosamine synthetase